VIFMQRRRGPPHKAASDSKSVALPNSNRLS
jgi:hypothetical protein